MQAVLEPAWWCVMGLNHDPDTYKVSALPIELTHRVRCIDSGKLIHHTLYYINNCGRYRLQPVKRLRYLQC